MAKEDSGSTLIKLLRIVVIGFVIAITLGTLFSLLYPTVEIDFSLSLLFIVVGLFIALLIQRVKRK